MKSRYPASVEAWDFDIDTCRLIQATGDRWPAVRLVQRGRSHYTAPYLVEGWMWVAAGREQGLHDQLPTMRYLARRKIAIAEKLGSRALRADAMEAITCGWLSFVVVIALAAQWAFGRGGLMA